MTLEKFVDVRIKPKPKTLADHAKNWDSLMEYFKTASESDLWKIYDYELSHKKRMSFVLRIYGRASEARMKREKREMALALSKV